MNKICTDIEQSRKLIELGIDANTADMLWTYDFTVNDINGLNVISKHLKPEENDIPAWSLSALLDMLDYEVVDEEGESRYLKIDKDDIEYQIRYEDRWNSGIETKWYDNLLDAAFEMVVWLKENNKL